MTGEEDKGRTGRRRKELDRKASFVHLLKYAVIPIYLFYDYLEGQGGGEGD